MAAADQYGSAILFAATFLVAYALLRKLRSYSSSAVDIGRTLKLPPALPSLPIIGSVLHLPSYSEFHRGLFEKKKTLGGIFGFYLGSRYVVVLQGREAILEALVKNSIEFSNRSSAYLKLVTNPDMKGILDRQYDATFKHVHHLSLTTLKRFGFGKGVMESRINHEVGALVDRLRLFDGQPFFPDPVLASSAMNVIGTVLFGECFREFEQRNDAFISDIYRFVRDLMKVVMINAHPWLRFLPVLRARYLALCATHDRMMSFLSNALDSCLQRDEDSSCSFAGSFCEAEKKTNNYDREELLYVVRDLIVAGTETSVTSLRWALVELANHRQLQVELQCEIDSVVGKSGGLASLDDRANLPLVEATLLELMRYRTAAPLSVPRETASDVEVGGYFIPQRTMIFTSLYSMHMDPDVWSDPASFRPRRFLSDDGRHVIGRDHLMPFGTGRRSCLGEVLARQELFLFVVGMLQHFNILPPDDDQNEISCHEIQTIVVAPSPFYVRMVPRCSRRNSDFSL